MSLALTTSWPSTISDLSWPEGGIKYSYEYRYIKTERLKLWLKAAFGEDVGKYVVRDLSLEHTLDAHSDHHAAAVQ